MNTLKDLLDDVAEQAKLYDRTEHALSVARRQRRLARVAPVALAVAVATGLAAVWLPLRSSNVDSDAAAMTPWLPQRLTVPEQVPPTLPTDHGVALGSLVYQTGDKSTLVTEDGRQYRLPGAGDGLLGVSPDGRWLATTSGDKVLLRDLTTTGGIQIAGHGGGAKAASWSPDGRRFALWTGSMAGNTAEPDVDPRIIVVDLASRTQWTTPAPGNVTLIGVLDSGDVVLEDRVSPDQVTSSTPVQLSIFNSQTGQVRHRYQIDLTPWLSPKERQARQRAGLLSDAALLADGRTLLLRPAVRVPGGPDGLYAPDDVLAVDLDTGSVTRRYDLPDPRIASATRDLVIDHNRTLGALLPEGVLYIHNGRTSPWPGGPISLELLDLSTGRLQVVSTVSPEVARILALRGGTG